MRVGGCSSLQLTEIATVQLVYTRLLRSPHGHAHNYTDVVKSNFARNSGVIVRRLTRAKGPILGSKMYLRRASNIYHPSHIDTYNT